jgi:hypothetical protein
VVVPRYVYFRMLDVNGRLPQTPAVGRKEPQR